MVAPVSGTDASRQPMNIALDIDGTITRRPKFFAVLSRAVRAAGGKVFIVTSRSDTAEVRALTRRELGAHGVAYDELVIIADSEQGRAACPHGGLDWYQKYLWQKVAACLDRDVAIVFEDDEKVAELFRRHAPQIDVFLVGKQ